MRNAAPSSDASGAQSVHSHGKTPSATSPAAAAAAPAAAASASGPGAGGPPPFTTRTGTALPREIVAWLQSLQLGGAVKYPRRDLANGYVIAQICAHYWPNMPMHSFSNTTSAPTREGNWYVLRKVLRKRGIDVTAAMVRGVMSSSGDCAVVFLQQLYTVLTGKHVDVEMMPLEEPLPEVAGEEVSVYVPSGTGGAAARTRYGAAAAAAVAGGGNAPRSSVHVDSRADAAGQRDKAATMALFGTPGAVGASAAAAVLLGGGRDPRAGAPPQLPPLPRPAPPPLPPPPAPSHTPAGGGASLATLSSIASGAEAGGGKPVLNVTVRPAGQVSTVMPLLGTVAGAAPAGGAGGAAGGGADGAVSRAPDFTSSVAAAWFCLKVRESLPADALEALMEAAGSGAAAAVAASGTLPLSAVVRWLARLPWPGSGDDSAFATPSGADADAREAQQVELRVGVWQCVFAAVPELAQILAHHGGHGFDVLVDALFAAVAEAQACLHGDADDQLLLISSGASRRRSAAQSFVRAVLHTCAALLATLSDLDVHHAIACFESYLAASTAFATAVRGVHWSLASNYAALLTAPLPTSRRLAAPLLRSLWSTVECVVRDAAAEAAAAADAGALNSDEAEAEAEAEKSGATVEGPEELAEGALLVLLRALLTSLLPINNNGVGGAAAARLPSSAAGGLHEPSGRSTAVSARRTAPRTGRSGGAAAANAQDAVSSALMQLAQQRSTAALQQASINAGSHSAGTAVTEAATALALEVLRVEQHASLTSWCVTGAPFFDVYNALFPASAADSDGNGDESGEEAAEEMTSASDAAPAPSPVLSVLRARWLRWCLQRRWEQGLSSQMPAASAAHAYAQLHRVSHASVSFGPASAENHRTTVAALAPSLASTVAAAAAAQEVWLESAEMHVLRSAVRRLCRELTAAHSDIAAPSNGTPDAQARVLVACALAQALPYLPVRYRTEAAAAAAAAGGGDKVRNPGTESDTIPSLPRVADAGDLAFAEDAADAALVVLICEASMAQVRAVLTGSSAASAPAPTTAEGDDSSAELAAAASVRWPSTGWVGTLVPSGILVLESDPLLLVRAALSVLHRSGGVSGGDFSGSNGVQPSASAAGGVEREAARRVESGGLRRLAARAAVAAREGHVDERIADRVRWLARLLVEGRATASTGAAATRQRGTNANAAAGGGGGGVGNDAAAATSAAANAGLRRIPSMFREDPLVAASAALSEADAAQWQAVLSRSYDDLVLVVQAASLRLRQRGGGAVAGSPANSNGGIGALEGREAAAAAAHLADAVGKDLLQPARQAEEVIYSLWRDLNAAFPVPSPKGPTTSAAGGATAAGGPVFSFLDGVSAEEMATAVAWMCAAASAPP